MTDCLADFFKRQEVEFVRNYKISELSSIRIGGNVAYLAMPDSEEKLIAVLSYLFDRSIKYRLVGRMTNILPCDEYFEGVVVSTAKINSYFRAENAVTASCGVLFSKMIYAVANKSYGGIEALYGIPGSVGGMVASNAGAYGMTISDVLTDARVYSISENKIFEVSNRDLDFSYRDSLLKKTDLVLLSASFEIQKRSSPEMIKNELKTIIQRRISAQPLDTKNIGSVFKRQNDTPVSYLIDTLGLKGYSVGGAVISEKHAGFIINFDRATAKDVKAIIAAVKEKVYNKYGFIPEEEIEIW